MSARAAWTSASLGPGGTVSRPPGTGVDDATAPGEAVARGAGLADPRADGDGETVGDAGDVGDAAEGTADAEGEAVADGAALVPGEPPSAFATPAPTLAQERARRQAANNATRITVN